MENLAFVLILLGFYVWVIVIAAKIGKERGRKNIAIFAAIVLGPFGIIIAAMLSTTVEAEARRQLAVEKELNRLRAQGSAMPKSTIAERMSRARGLGQSVGRQLRGKELPTELEAESKPKPPPDWP